MRGLHRAAAALAAIAALTDAARSEETIPGVQSHHHSVTTSDGALLRAIVTQPADAKDAHYPVIFTQWVSCGSIEYAQGSSSREILAAIARETGLALLRVERSAESGGPPCEALDYDTEVAHYVDAYAELLKTSGIDSSKVFVYGSSLGATTAPLVASALQERGYDIAGIVVQGGGAETYFERMLTFERQNLERRPDAVAPTDIHEEMLDRARFYFEYLVESRHPDAVAMDSADMARVRRSILGLADKDHYGRPFAWHQQAAQRNLLGAWASLDAQALVIFNEYDQYEALYGANAIVETLNRARPGSATLRMQHGLDHSSYRFASVYDAYADRGGEPAWRQTADEIVSWLRRISAE